jgi:HK97 family phage portal protein
MNKKSNFNIFKFFSPKPKKMQKKNYYEEIFPASYYKTIFQSSGKPNWMPRNFEKFADEGYKKNVIVHRCINLIASSLANIPWKVFYVAENERVELKNHPLLKLLSSPNPISSGSIFFESLAAFKLISGNSFMLVVKPEGDNPKELYSLRPDRVKIITDKFGNIIGYQYKSGDREINYPVDKVTGKSKILHLKTFNPLNDYYGMSPIEAAAYSIDQHNNAGEWNQSLLENGAKPSGALVFKNPDGSAGSLSDEQFRRLKNQIEEEFSGAENAGKPILLEGGLDWKEMSLSPKDMDFIECKHSSARDIALAFGVPPQLLGIPGDNTYSNLSEARLSLWEQTIIPLMEDIKNGLNHWLVPMFDAGENLELCYDSDKISALAPRRDSLWARAASADFLTANEKRALVGLEAV